MKPTKISTSEFNIKNPPGTIVMFSVGESFLGTWTEYPARKGCVKCHGFKRPLELRQVEVLGGRIYE